MADCRPRPSFVLLTQLAEIRAGFADRDRASDVLHMLDAVEDRFNRHAQHRLVDDTQNEQTLQALPEGLQVRAR